MYKAYPNIIDSLCNKSFKYRKGRVYFHNLYQRKLNQKHKQKVDQIYVINEQMAKCFQYDIILPLQQQGFPDICDCLNAHTDKYRKGKVPIQMIYQEEPLRYHYFPVPTVIDAMNGHCNKYKKGKVQLNDIYRPDIDLINNKQSKAQHNSIIDNHVQIDLSEANERYQWEIDLLGIA